MNAWFAGLCRFPLGAIMTNSKNQDDGQENNQRTIWRYHPTLTKIQYGHPMAKIVDFEAIAEKEIKRNFD